MYSKTKSDRDRKNTSETERGVVDNDELKKVHCKERRD